MSGSSQHFKYHTHRLKAHPDLVRKLVHVGDTFRRAGNRSQLYPFKVTRITKMGRVVFERKLGVAKPETKTLCIKVCFGIPYAQYDWGVKITPEGQDYWDGRIDYNVAIRQAADSVIGKHFLDSNGEEKVILSYDKQSFKVKTLPYSYKATLGFVSPEKPIQVLETFWGIDGVKKLSGSEYVPVTWTRDYSREVQIVLSCYAWGLPHELAIYIVQLFWDFEYYHYKTLGKR